MTDLIDHSANEDSWVRLTTGSTQTWNFNVNGYVHLVVSNVAQDQYVGVDAVKFIAPPAITSIAPFCNGTTSQAGITFSGIPGDFGGFYVDIDRDGNWDNGFFNRFVPATTAGTYTIPDAPAGFQPAAGESGTLTFTSGSTYWVRVYNGKHSSVQTFTASDCRGGVTVTITATDASAAEGTTPDTGTFTVSRTGSTTSSLTVFYSTGGTATPGSDYTTLSGSVTIAAGSSTATITVTPIDDTVAESSETVVVTLSASSAYTVGFPSSATVTIADNDSLSTVSITATDASAAEGAIPDTGTFTVSRTGSTTSSLTVFYSTGGTATSGSDYTALPGSVTIAAGSSTATITVTPIDDTVVEGDETVVVSLLSGSGYSVGSPSTATVTITDNDSTPQLTLGPTSLNFGSVQVGSCSTAYFAIQHVLGTGPASGTVSASPNPPFSIASGSSFSVSNGGAANVGVQFCPTSATTFSGSATVSSPGTTFTNTNTVTLTGTGCTPTLYIDGGPSSTKPQLQTFYFTGSCYTPNGTVTRYLRQPDGSTIILTPTLSADSSGNISWTYTPPCTAPTGTYIVWAVDNATGKTSNTVTEIITLGSGCTTCIDTYEPNDSSTTAYGPLTRGSTYSSKICSSTDVDWYKITVASAGTITLTLTVPSTNDYDMELYTSVWVAGSYNGTGATETISYYASTPGTYYIRIYGYNGSFNTTSSYTLWGTWP